MTILIKNAYIITGDNQNNILEEGDIVINNRSIEYVGIPKNHGLDFDKVIDGSNKLVIPDLINAHTHTHATISKGVLEKDFHALFM